MKLAGAIRAGYEYRAVQLVILAYREMIKDSAFDIQWHETRFSAVLMHHIDNLCRQFSKETQKIWHVEREHYNDSEAIARGEADPDAAPRIDIVMYSWSWQSYQKQRYPFESKRLAENDADLVRLYVEKGMTRYINEDKDYGAGGAWGGMLAYVIEGDISSLVERINDQLDRQLGGEPEHEHLQHHTRVIQFDSIFSSRHYYSKINDHIRLTHIFLRFHMMDRESSELTVPANVSEGMEYKFPR